MQIATDAEALRAPLRALGHEVCAVPEHLTARVDVVALAGADAWDRLRGWRAAGHRQPVLVWTEAPPAPDRARLEPVVLLRVATVDAVRAALEASDRGRPAGRVHLRAGVADLDLRRFEGPNRSVDLSPLECRLLGYLAARSGRAIGRDELQLQVWDHRKALATRAVHMSVARLRKKIEPDPSRPVSLLTAPGGYRLLVIDGISAGDSGLVGRDDLLADLERALSTHGAVCLHGPPGVGKTALLRALARRAVGRSLRVDLHGVGSVATAAEAMARAAGLGMPAGLGAEPAWAHVLERVRARGDLLLVDHLDDLGELWPRLVSLPRVVGASRQRLRGGVARAVPPLSAEVGSWWLLREAERQGVTLSTEAARTLTTGVDGLPLALRLIAAHLPSHDPDELGLDALLTLGDRGTPSLATALGASVDRLTPSARRLLAALSLVRGAVDAGVARVLGGDAAAGWTSLVDSGLVHRVGDERRVLRAVREHATRALPEARAAAVPAYVGWMSELAARAQTQLDGADARRVRQQLTARRPDLEHAWSLACTLRDPRVVPLTLGIDGLLTVYGTQPERIRRFEAARAACDDPAGRRRLLLGSVCVDPHRDRARSCAVLREVAEEADDPDVVVRARIWEARLLYWTEGPAAARAVLEGVDGGPVRRLLVELERLQLRSLLGEIDLVAAQSEGLRLSEDLAQLGHLRGAARAAIMASDTMALTGVGDPLAVARRAVDWVDALGEERGRAAVRVSLGTRLGEAMRTDEALACFDEAERVFERVHPLRMWQVVKMRAAALAHGGAHRRARQELERYLEWSRARTGRRGVVDAALWLAAVELDDGFPLRALRHARSAAEGAERLGNVNALDHAALHGALALLELGRADEACGWLATRDPARMVGPYDVLRWRTLCFVAGGTRDGDGLRQAAAAVPGGLGERARRLTAAGLDGSPRALAEAAEPRSGELLWVRLLARSWNARASDG